MQSVFGICQTENYFWMMVKLLAVWYSTACYLSV